MKPIYPITFLAIAALLTSCDKSENTVEGAREAAASAEPVEPAVEGPAE